MAVVVKELTQLEVAAFKNAIVAVELQEEACANGEIAYHSFDSFFMGVRGDLMVSTGLFLPMFHTGFIRTCKEIIRTEKIVAPRVTDPSNEPLRMNFGTPEKTSRFRL